MNKLERQLKTNLAANFANTHELDQEINSRISRSFAAIAFVTKGFPRCAREIKKPGWFARLFQLS
jgi:hypothetical protein